ncbi:MAG: alpha/beta hydrolase [Ilumatobacteraceae bacterium]
MTSKTVSTPSPRAPAAAGARSLRIRPTALSTAEARNPEQYFLPSDPADLLVADPARRVAVTFRSGTLNLAGHLYRPPGADPSARLPGVVLCGPFSSVKEQTLPHYAERLADAGYTVLTFDPSNLGESEGEPRAHYDPNAVIADFSCGVAHLATRDDVDHDRIGAVGVCMGGGYAVSLGARDRRVRAVVSVAGGYDIGGTFQKFMGVDGFAAYYRKVNDLVQRQYETGEIAYIPTTARSLSAEIPVAAMPNEEAHSYYERTSRSDAPNWSPVMTAASLEPYFIYNAIAHAPLVAPTPLMIVHGTNDASLLPEFAQAAYDAASGVKELVWIETHNHIEVYDQEPYVSEAVGHVLRWLDAHLAPSA